MEGCLTLYTQMEIKRNPISLFSLSLYFLLGPLDSTLCCLFVFTRSFLVFVFSSLLAKESPLWDLSLSNQDIQEEKK